MKNYVAGLMFSADKTKVALVIKNKPDWQKGLLNAIGGKIETEDYSTKKSIKLISYEAASKVAMVREFEEETGVWHNNQNWELFLTMGSDVGKTNDEKIQQYSEAWSVDFYRTFSDRIYDVRTKETEEIVIKNVSDLFTLNTIDNLKWIILLALDKNPKMTDVHY